MRTPKINLVTKTKGYYMGMFDSIDQSTKVEVEEETLGGGGNYVKTTGVYDYNFRFFRVLNIVPSFSRQHPHH